MAMNVGEAEKMLAASEKSGAALIVAHCWRFDEEVLTFLDPDGLKLELVAHAGAAGLAGTLGLPNSACIDGIFRTPSILKRI